jgi:hypothetical protein
MPRVVAQRLHFLQAAARRQEQSMSTFDNPFDPDRSLHSRGCSCGLHASEAEHHAAAQLQLQAQIGNEQKRYQGVVASAVMRAMFPRDAARRAFLKSVGAATAAAALSQFFPLKTATEAFAQGGRRKRRISRSASSRSLARRRSSWRPRWDFTRGTD